MAAPRWTYLIADLRTNAILGELPLAGPRMSKLLNAAGTLTATTLPLSDRRMRDLDVFDMTRPARRAVYAVRDARPWWGGIIWTSTRDSASDTVSIGAGDFWTYFDHRKLLPVLTVPPPSYTYVAERTTTYGGVEQNQLARNLVALAQSHTGGDIGLAVDATSSGITRDRTYRGFELTDVGEALRQLAGVIDGPDICFDVGGPDTAGRPTRLLRLGTPLLGQQGSPHVWEAGGNILSYKWPSDGTRMATRTFAVGDGIDQGALIAVAEDTARYADGWPLLESETGYTTVTTTDVLQEHADADQVGARLPVVLPQLVVKGDSAPRVGEYGVGDDARVVIRDSFFRAGIDTPMRVIGIEISPGEDVEAVTLTMSPLLEDVF